MWPSRAGAQYNSSTTGRDQLNITMPISGWYVFIAVYSADTDSRYSILITGEGRITPLYVYGNPITAQVSARRSLYYVATVPPLFSLATYLMAVTLRSLSGNADLYISDTYMYPNATHCNWTSEAAGDGLDIAVLRGDVAPDGSTQLHPGNYYVAVRGSTTASFQLWTYLRMRQYLQVNSMLSYYHYGGVVYFEIEVPRGVQFIISAIPLAFYGGSFNLYIGNVAEPIPSVATTFQVVASGVVRVTPAVSPCTGSGPICRYYVAIERVNNETETSYASFDMFVYSPDMPPTYLLPDVPLEKQVALPGGTVYQFNVTCPRSKVTITLVTTNSQFRLSNAPMLANRGPLPPFTVLDNVEFGYAESVTLGLRTFTLSFDWNHPLLRGASMVGRYMLTVRPTFTTGWTLLLRTDGGRCVPLPPMAAMQQLMPYTVTVSPTSMLYFSFQVNLTGSGAAGYTYFTLTPRNTSVPLSVSLSGVSMFARSDGDVPAADYAEWSSTATGMLRVAADACWAVATSSNSSAPVCVYTLMVMGSGSSAAMSSTDFFLTASTGQPLYSMDASVPSARLACSVPRSAPASGTALVPRGSTSVELVTEACSGSVNVYLNCRTAAIPTGSQADVSAAAVTSPIALACTLSPASATQLIASVVGAAAVSSSFETRLLVNTGWAASAPTSATSQPMVTDYRTVSTGYARVKVPLAVAPAAVSSGAIRPPTGGTGYLRYSLYLLDKNDTSNSSNLRARCGLQASSTVLVHTAFGLTSGTNTLDVKLPVSSHRYTLVVLVDHVWRTGKQPYMYESSSAAYITYNPVDVRGGTKAPEDDSSSSSGMAPPPPGTQSSSGWSTSTVAIVSVVAFVVVVVALLLAVRYYKRKAISESGMLLLDGHKSSLPSDSFVMSHSQQQPSQLTGEAFYAMTAEGQ